MTAKAMNPEELEVENDVCGVPITIGRCVAYNYSGEVHPGRICDIKIRKKYGRNYIHYIVRNQLSGVKSEVTSRKNLMVLK